MDKSSFESALIGREALYKKNVESPLFLFTGGPKVSTHTLGLIPPDRRVLYLRVVALQVAYCTYFFENSVVKILKFEYFRPRPFNSKTPILYCCLRTC